MVIVVLGGSVTDDLLLPFKFFRNVTLLLIHILRSRKTWVVAMWGCKCVVLAGEHESTIKNVARGMALAWTGLTRQVSPKGLQLLRGVSLARLSAPWGGWMTNDA